MGVSFKNGHETNNIFAKNYYNPTTVWPHNKPTKREQSSNANHGSYT